MSDSRPRPSLRFRPGPKALVLVAGLLALGGCGPKQEEIEDQFQRLSTQGRGLYESGEPAKAVETFRQAVALQPTHPDARQNLANALLRANDPAGAAEQAAEMIRLNQNVGAAHYLLGAAFLREGRAEPAVAELQTSKDIDRTVNAVSYLLGRAHEQLGHLDDATALYEEVTQFETNHPSAYYNLSQTLTRLGRSDEAARALESHRGLMTQRGGAPVDQSAVERCTYTEIRVPFRLDQPDARGISMTFIDDTPRVLGAEASRYGGPIAVVDVNHDGSNDLFVRDGDTRFRLLLNQGGQLKPAPNAVTVAAGARFSRVLVGDLNKDRYEDIVLLGEQGLYAYRLATNGGMTDSTAFSNLRNQPAEDGLLADFDFTGNLDLVLVTPGTRSLRLLRNLGNMYFTNATDVSGFPADLGGVAGIATDDWNGDELNDFFVARPGAAPALLSKQRGGPLTNAPPAEPWPAGVLFAVGDLNNDLRNDLVVAESGRLSIVLNGFTQRIQLPLDTNTVQALILIDYDNDGWLDLMASTSRSLRAWRNSGTGGFHETTTALGLDTLPAGTITSLTPADLDRDGDTDLVAVIDGKSLRVLRNEGGDANQQLKLRLLGTRSNASGLGLRIELTAGRWRALRTVNQLPIEIGVGKRDRIDSLNVRWFDTLSTDVDTPVERGQEVALIELIRPTGSCPYLYRWDGEQFAFVTDLLGASPLGLPVAKDRYVEADPDEIVRVGEDGDFRVREGYYSLEITEELREMLYLDEAALLVVDHPADTEVHPTDKLMPGRPFAPTGVKTIRNPRAPRHALNLEGDDVTEALQSEDQVMVSPARLRPPQQRGYAERHGVTLDFGPLDTDRPLVLLLNGWLRFGGGMANMAASRDPEIPFPFPRLEVEVAGVWRDVDVVVGAPCGKTKTILVDLEGRLPKGAGRLRLTSSFEIHWDRIALCESAGEQQTQLHRLEPDRATLRWRGYSEFKARPWTQPLTPDHGRVRAWPDWRITPAGWCTRYGDVRELVSRRDGGMVLLNGGDALALDFPASSLPTKASEGRRSFFLFTVGWDKDADFHVVEGDRVDPLPWEGMDDQRYGQQTRPWAAGDELTRRYRTRWVGPMAQVRR